MLQYKLSRPMYRSPQSLLLLSSWSKLFIETQLLRRKKTSLRNVRSGAPFRHRRRQDFVAVCVMIGLADPEPKVKKEIYRSVVGDRPHGSHEAIVLFGAHASGKRFRTSVDGNFDISRGS